MLSVTKTGFWGKGYRIDADGRELTTWDVSFWRSGGDFVLDGHPYRVRTSGWRNLFTMTDDQERILATATRVGRKRWTVEAGGHTYHFRRQSFWSGNQELHDDAGPRGIVRRSGFWQTTITADLPTLPPPVQVFVIGVVITMWNQQAAAAAAS
ncbi:hypothetical protein ACIA8K_19220 [Catenuloplanes sp. NPDC051500]|uniref:hypothetical protein n=1 Tax=Catenuloplanes sp. NPDC051500 TaxID=3363959 RepID=UPI0037B46A38